MRLRSTARSFSLVQLLAVIGIMGVFLWLLFPFASAARKRAKTAYCLSRLHDIGSAVGTYATENIDQLPPAAIDWHPTLVAGIQRLNIDRCELPVIYGWAELLSEHLRPGKLITDWTLFPAQRNYQGRYERLFNCPEALQQESHGSHFRVYLPHWAHEALHFDEHGRIDAVGNALTVSGRMQRMRPLWVLIGDSNEETNQGDYRGRPAMPDCVNPDVCPAVETAVIGLRCAGDLYNEANAQVRTCDDPERVQNRFEHRHSGAANYLFADLHAQRSATLRARLACDWDLNGVCDCRTRPSAEFSGCDSPCPQP